MIPVAVVCLSVLAQVAAAASALRLIPLTGGRKSWILIAAALLGMAVRRIIPLYHLLHGGDAYPPPDLAYELVGLLTSLCMLAGITWIAPLIRGIRDSEEAIRRSEERYRRIVDTSQEGIWILDAEGSVRFANRRLGEMLGVPAGELADGRPVDRFLDEEGRGEVRRQLERRKQGETGCYDLRLRRADGETLWTVVSASPIVDAAGRFTGSLGMIADFSERKRMEEEREHLIGKLQEALAGIRTLSGLLPICSACKKIRDDRGYWDRLESFITRHSGAEFTHGYCPECTERIRRNI